MIWRCACGFRFLMWSFLTEFHPLFDLEFPFWKLVSATPTSFVRLFWKYAGYFATIWKCACSFGFLIWSFLTVTVLFDSEFPFSKLVTCSATPTTSFVRFFWKCPSFLAMIWKCTSGLGFLIWSVLTLMALSDLEYSFAELVSATRDTFFVRFFLLNFAVFLLQMVMYFWIFDQTIFKWVAAFFDLEYSFSKLMSTAPITFVIGLF